MKNSKLNINLLLLLSFLVLNTGCGQRSESSNLAARRVQLCGFRVPHPDQLCYVSTKGYTAEACRAIVKDIDAFCKGRQGRCQASYKFPCIK